LLRVDDDDVVSVCRPFRAVHDRDDGGHCSNLWAGDFCGHELRSSDQDITMQPRDEVVARTQYGAHLAVARDHARPNPATDASSPCGIIDSVATSSRERV
jgi:hypothetical protein